MAGDAELKRDHRQSSSGDDAGQVRFRSSATSGRPAREHHVRSATAGQGCPSALLGMIGAVAPGYAAAPDGCPALLQKRGAVLGFMD